MSAASSEGQAAHHPQLPVQDSGLTTETSRRALYEGYCRRQAAALLSLIPRDGIRPLYRQARESVDVEGRRGADGPLEILNAFCRELLPLPTYDVWSKDFEQHPEAHLEDMRRDPALGPQTPLAVEIRGLEETTADWLAELNIFPDGDVWRGFIEFRGNGPDELTRTADIFRDPDPIEIRRRFRSFEQQTLQAFLRSTLP